MVDDLVPFFDSAREDGLSLRESFIRTVEEFQEPHDRSMIAYRRTKAKVTVTVHDSDASTAALPILNRSDAVHGEAAAAALIEDWGTVSVPSLENAPIKVKRNN